jgi:dCMP deaminase
MEVNRPNRILETKKDQPQEAGVIRNLNKQHDFDLMFLEMCFLISQRSRAKRNQVGAIITKDNRPISLGYNGTPVGFDNACEGADGETLETVVHAEVNAICFLARTHESTEGTTIYSTLAPCSSCARMIIQAGIKRVVYRNRYRYDSGVDMLKEANIEVLRLHPRFTDLKNDK